MFNFLGKVSEEQSGAALFRTGKPITLPSTVCISDYRTKAAREKCILVGGGGEG
jgi:hypothetical protein